MMARMPKFGFIVAAGLVIIALWAIPHSRNKELSLAGCFDNVMGLRVGAAVRIAGVEVGRVTQVRARPDRKDCPAEVAMSLSTPYDLKVPNDALAGVSTEGLLGQEYVDIDVRHATGPPAIDCAVLKTTPAVAPADTLRALVDAIAKKANEETAPLTNPSAKKK